MPEPLVTTNPAEYTQLEGVYISPKDPPPFVKEVGFANTGIFATALRGPTDKAVAIRSPRELKNIYGLDRYDAGGTAINSELYKFLLNKKFGSLVIYRVAASDAVKGSFTLEDTAGGAGATVCRIDASAVGLYGRDVYWKVEDATDADANHWNLRIKYKGEEFLYENIDTGAGTPGNDNTATTIGTGDTRLIDLVKIADGRPFNSIASADGADANGYTYLGQTVALFTSVAASDGTIAATDYTAVDGPLYTLAEYKGIGIVACGNEDGTITAAVNAIVKTKGALSSDRLFLIHEGELTGSAVSASSVITDVASFRDGRIVYCHNSPYTVDPQTAMEVITSPVSWMACILANTDVDIHPGEDDTIALLAGISRLDQPAISRENYKALKAAGIASLERNEDGEHLFVSGVVTIMTAGKTEITYRRMRDFIQLSAARFARPFVKKKGTQGNQDAFGGGLEGWLDGLKKRERIVRNYSVDIDGVNDETTEAQGLEYVGLDVQLINHWLHIVFLTDIGTGTIIEQ